MGATMTKEEIIEMAKQTGLAIGVALDGSKSVGKHEDKSFAVGRLPLEDFVAFAKLVAEKEREACAKIAENRILHDENKDIKKGYLFAQQSIAQDIRTRGQE